MTDALDLDGWLSRFEVRVIWRPLLVVEELVCPPVILLPTGLPLAEQRWRTAHALGHIALHGANQVWLLRHGYEGWVRKQERQANEWAADALLPYERLGLAVHEGLSFQEIAEHFGVTEQRVRFAVDLFGQRVLGRRVS